uniref:Uncharacterized protein n=1 Tax=Panagrolaimus sp. ES5 TaxID=591445 RepID=A0AC34GAM7_9BILA
MSSPPPPYSSRPNSSVENKNELHLEIYYDSNGIPYSLPGAIATAPVISTISTMQVNPGYYNPQNNNIQHFPGLREGGGLTTPDGGRYFVRRNGQVEYLTEQEFQDRRKCQWICCIIFIIFAIILIFALMYIPQKIEAAAYAAEHAKENEEKIKKEAEAAARTAWGLSSLPMAGTY